MTRQFLTDIVTSEQIPALAIEVSRETETIQSLAFGQLNPSSESPSATTDTIFLVASITKPVVTTAVMLLVERGLLSLDDLVHQLIPEFNNNGKEDVQVYHLMTHTSGLPDMLPENTQLRQEHAPLAEFVKRICQLPLDFTPGTQIQYQSCGIALLGEIIERLTGNSLPHFLHGEIFQPLQMHRTSLGLGPLPVDQIAYIDVGVEMENESWNWNSDYWRNFAAPWGGMFSTVKDLSRFGQMFLQQGKLGQQQCLLSPATVEAMTADHTAYLPQIPANQKVKSAWGLGWRIHTPFNMLFGSLPSAGTFGHYGATGTVTWIDLQRRVVCVILTSQPKAHQTGILARCSNILATAID